MRELLEAEHEREREHAQERGDEEPRVDAGAGPERARSQTR